MSKLINLFLCGCICFLLPPSYASAVGQPSAASKSSARSPEYVEPLTGMEFVLVPGGCFYMGSPLSEIGRYSDESQPHEVCVDDFMISRYEVTNAQFRKYQPQHSSRTHEGLSLDDDRQPVVFVSWQDSVEYAKWLSQEARQSFRLPTEAEWEMAARAGEEGPRFWDGDANRACKYANVGDRTAEKGWKNWARWPVFACEDGSTVSAPVGSYQANALGLYDMLGNVWEWTADWYDEAEKGDSPGRNDHIAGLDRVLRGGSWYSGPANARLARRSWLRPKDKCNSLGFRLVMAIDRREGQKLPSVAYSVPGGENGSAANLTQSTP